MNYRFFIFGLIAILSSLVSFSQQRDDSIHHGSKHKYVLKASLLKNYNRNVSDAEHWVDISAKNANTDFLTAVNKFSYQIGVMYEYNFSNGLFISPSLLFGEHRFQYKWDFSFDYFFNSNNSTPYTTEYVYAKNIPYLALGLNIGYRTQPLIKNRFQLETKGGVNYMKFLKKYGGLDYHSIVYSRNDTVFSQLFAQTDYQSRSSLFYYSIYLGGVYAVNSKYISEYRIGFEFMRAFSLFGKGLNHTNLIHGTYYNEEMNIVSEDSYINRFRNVAITFGIVF